jgi:hypothetical protein
MSSPIPRDPELPPRSMQLAAALFIAYGVAVIVNATAVQGSAGWTGGRDLAWAVVRLIAATAVAAGLLRGARWAWWAGVGFGMLGLAAGALPLFVLEHGDMYWLPPSGFQLVLVASLVCLGGAVGTLLRRSVRRLR